jgi:5-methylcytosine-specific restriction endonuclease McrBC GTP-binding regulatory subunit McrB
MGYQTVITNQNIQINGTNFDIFCDLTEKELKQTNNKDGLRVLENLKNASITIPSNLSIIATINTSDESIYYLDSAFKRRWDWEYVDVPNSKRKTPEEIKNVLVVIGENKYYWYDLVIKLNEFIKSKNGIRRIEDKQIGWWFLKANKKGVIEESVIANKLMFYLWDSVFAKDKRPLEELLDQKLITYGEFANLSSEFIKKINSEELKKTKIQTLNNF